MVACFDLITLNSGPCGECGRAHRFRATTAADESVAARPLCGFFASCPATRRRAWFVVELPAELPMRLLETGPADDDGWEPAAVNVPFRASADPELTLAPAARFSEVPLPRGMNDGGFRGMVQTPERLRRALGCPHTR